MKITPVNATRFKDYDNHESVYECIDEKSGLHAFIAIHNSNLGPALGGCRVWPYISADQAITDVLRLSRGMTYKSAMAELPLGGGKAVILADSKTDKTRGMLLAMGDFVDSLQGRYVTAEDSGTSVSDLQVIGENTQHVAGVTHKELEDGSRVSGDPSPSTAYGVFVGIKASAEYKYGAQHNLDGLKVAVQGVGNVGKRVANFLVNAGATVYVADIFEKAVTDLANELEVTPVALDEIHKIKADVFAPCALGGFITEQTLTEMSAPVIAGAANNQLIHPGIGELIIRQDKLFAPDYVINAGGIIDIFYERSLYDHRRVLQHIDKIADNLRQIFTMSEESGEPTQLVADTIAESRFLKKHECREVA